MTDAYNFTPGPAYVGHGMPGVDLFWHRKGAPCPVCEEEAANPKPPRVTVTAVDSVRGVISIESTGVEITPPVPKSGRIKGKRRAGPRR